MPTEKAQGLLGTRRRARCAALESKHRPSHREDAIVKCPSRFVVAALKGAPEPDAQLGKDAADGAHHISGKLKVIEGRKHLEAGTVGPSDQLGQRMNLDFSRGQ